MFFLSLIAFFALSLQAAVVDTIYVHSDAMNKDIQTIVFRREKEKRQLLLFTYCMGMEEMRKHGFL